MMGSQMEQFIVEPEYDGKSLVRVILAHYPGLPANRIFQALRNRDVRLNGRRLRADRAVQAGDQVIFFISIGSNTAAPGDTGHDRADAKTAGYEIVYQDSSFLLVNKKPGMPVQPARHVSGPFPGEDTRPCREPNLLTEIRRDFQDDAIELGHRLDRQTGGLVMLARKPDILASIGEQQKAGRIVKRYRCLVVGVPQAGTHVVTFDGLKMREISSWLEKDAGRSEVYIHDLEQPGDRPVTTRYRILRTYPAAAPGPIDVSELEVELVTGRTHQIRAQFAHAGHPVLGDGKYGRNHVNRLFRDTAGKPLHRQQLWAAQISFLPEIKGSLAYLAGRTFKIEASFDWHPDT
jgi:23S rRNA pseudouridine955/2504/2580 synthase